MGANGWVSIPRDGNAVVLLYWARGLLASLQWRPLDILGTLESGKHLLWVWQIGYQKGILGEWRYFDKNGKNDDNSENLANNRKRVGEKLNEITRGAPYKVAKLMNMANLIN